MCYDDLHVILLTLAPVIVLKPGPAGRPGTWPTRGWNRAGLKKKREKEKPGVTRWVDPARPDQDPVVNPLTFFFVFLLKRRRFDFKKKRTDPANLVTRSKPGTRALDRARS